MLLLFWNNAGGFDVNVEASYSQQLDSENGTAYATSYSGDNGAVYTNPTLTKTEYIQEFDTRETP